VSDVHWELKFGEPNRVTATPELGVGLVVERRPRTGKWGAQLTVQGQSAWQGEGYALSSVAKKACEQRYRAWRSRSRE